jgi:threonine synthase
MLTPYECRCGRSYAPAADRWRCDCGGLLDLPLATEPWRPRVEDRSMWRHLDADDLPWREITLGEGGTPLVEEGGGLYLKVEFASPTGSFKDRGAVVLVALARALGATRLVADSSGNAGTAVAAYAARGGIPAEIFVPAGTSEKKVHQIKGHGAEIVMVEGAREDAAAAAIARVEESGAFYASHVYNPYFHVGTKTYGLEVFEQLGGVAPTTLALPAGNGTLVLGAHRAFAELRAAGVVDRIPRIVAVQAERCAPLAAAWAAGRADPAPVRPGPTIAEGIAIADPARGSRILAAVDDSGGAFVTVTEDEIAGAHAALAARGLWVEPTGAVSYAAVLRLRAEGSPLVAGGPVVVPLCGSGLKASL